MIDNLRKEFANELSENNLKLYSLDCEQGVVIGHAKKAREVATKGIEMFSSMQQSTSFGELLICYGIATELLGDIKQASKFLDRAILLAEKLQDPTLQTYAYRARGDINAYHSTAENALLDLHKAYRIADNNNDEFNLLLAKNSLANLYAYIKDFDKALDYYSDVYDDAKKSNNQISVSAIAYNMARVYQDLEQTEKAIKYFDESHLVSKQIGDDAGVAYALNGVGIIALHQQKIESAQTQLEKASATFNDLGE